MTTTRLGLILLAVIAAGCSGGSDGGSEQGEPSSKGRGKVTVTVVNTVGEPVAGANVQVLHWRDGKLEADIIYNAITDASGRTEVTGIRPGRVHANAIHPEFEPRSSDNSKELVAGGSLEFDLALRPRRALAGGVIAATVAPGGVSADGQTLEFTLQIVDLPGPVSRDWDDFTGVQINACNPLAGNDAPVFRADCISGPDGFDAPYAAAVTSSSLPHTRIWPTAAESSTRAPFAAALLIDQSAAYAVTVPAGKRLRAAKYFLDGATEQEPVVLAAFAADRPVSNYYGLLPSKPVSVFPIENPQLTTSGRSLFSTVDALATMEGGAASPLAAVDRMLDFMAIAGGAGRRDIVVLTNGHDDTCGTRAECGRLRDAVVAKARSLQVRIVTVGANAAGDAPDREMLGLLAQATAGSAAFWTDDPALLPSVLQSVRHYLGTARPSVQATFRIRSPVAGAFASGRMVTGWVSMNRGTDCMWDCETARVPFAVRIP